MKKAKHFMLGFLVAERRGLFLNPIIGELEELHKLEKEINSKSVLEQETN